MSKFSTLLKKFKDARDQIKEAGAEMVEKYPHTKLLVNMAQEVGVAGEALDHLIEEIEKALQSAEADEDLKKELTTQIKESPVYADFSDDERKKLAEHLVQTKQPLATEDTLTSYIQKSLDQKAVSDLVTMYPKALLVKKGESLNDGTKGFDAYTAGLNAIKKAFEADKAAGVKNLATLWLSQGMDKVAREYYKAALKPEAT